MKKISMFLAAMTIMVFSAKAASAQEAEQATAAAVEEVSAADEGEIDPFKVKSEVPLHQALKTKFIEGGAGFMSLIIICLIIGLALSIERILYLSFSKVNAKALVAKVETALKEGGIDAAKEVCRNTRGPVAKIFYDGLDRYDQGIDVVEKNVVSSGSIQMSLLENGLSWISLFIAIAPSLGFLGTVIGMIQAFDAIQAAG
ncbi:MAG: MotA/TolQ/ExbB proton channel family protein, partial [Candidatus Cryptobacteroides sp.]